MRVNVRSYFLIAAIGAIVLNVPASIVIAQDAHFHNAPASSNQLKNPYAGQPTAAVAGSRVYATNCSSCHGIKGAGPGASLHSPKDPHNQHRTERSFGSSQPGPSITVCRLGPAYPRGNDGKL